MESQKTLHIQINPNQNILQSYNNKVNIMVEVCTHTKSLVDQWNKIKNPNMSIHNFGHLVFNKEAGKHTLEKETTFKTGQQENWMSK